MPDRSDLVAAIVMGLQQIRDDEGSGGLIEVQRFRELRCA